MSQKNAYDFANGYAASLYDDSVVAEQRVSSPAEWLIDVENAGGLLTGDQLEDLDQSTAHIVIPIDAVVALGDVGSTGPSDHGLELVPLGSLGGKIMSQPAVAERLTDEAGLRRDDRLYTGVILYDRWTNNNEVTPWAAIGSRDRPIRGVYNGIPTRYVLLG
ncbi:hypothetical protein pqer_cds_903 [Pandoravirus quercus]|nr:hypothetical protein pqer_cds_903 [Pandoravirus quercus]AVK75325.1 hypothetical protein pqer_cds_903 [Pandoravirus quercus]